MKITKKAISASILAAGLVLTGVTAAHAGTGYYTFTANMPKLQQAWSGSTQVKTYSNTSGNVTLTSVGSDYKANARMCLTQNHNTCGTEVKSIGDGGSGLLTNTFAKSTSVQLQLHETPYAVVDVTAKGKWRSN